MDNEYRIDSIWIVKKEEGGEPSAAKSNTSQWEVKRCPPPYLIVTVTEKVFAGFTPISHGR